MCRTAFLTNPITIISRFVTEAAGSWVQDREVRACRPPWVVVAARCLLLLEVQACRPPWVAVAGCLLEVMVLVVQVCYRLLAMVPVALVLEACLDLWEI